MKLIDIHFYHFNPKFNQPITTPKVTMTHRSTLIVGLIDDGGKEWFGEANVFETDWYYEETIGTVKHEITKWFKCVKYKSLSQFEDCVAVLNNLNHAPAARATLMMAFYPMFHDLSTFEVAPVQTINGDFNQRLLNLNHAARLKLKWSSNIEKQFHMIRTVYPDVPMSLDANQTLTEKDVNTLNALWKEDVAYIEEPFADKTLLNTDIMLPPVAIDESATSIEHILQLTKIYPISVVVLKPFRLGGIDRTLEAMQCLQEKGVKVVIGGMYETALSRYYTALLSRRGDYVGDVPPHGYYFEHDLCDTSGQLQQGMLTFKPPQVDPQRLMPF